MKYRTRNQNGEWLGGPMYYMRDGLHQKTMANIYAFFAILGSLGMGNLAQVHTISSVFSAAAAQFLPDIPRFSFAIWTGIVVACIMAFATLGGSVRIGKILEKLVPAAACLYLFGSTAVILANINRIPGVFHSILIGAFSPRAVIGGGAGIGIRQAVRWGISRGVFSNEAGLGSASIAHASTEDDPDGQSLFGIFEVFFDTIVLCTLTAVTILCSGIPIPYGAACGAELSAAALSTVFSSFASPFQATTMILLAMATLLSWQLYGSRCAYFLWGAIGQQFYSLLYLFVMVIGTRMNLTTVWAISDGCNGMMAIPNLIALLVLSKNYLFSDDKIT